MKNLLFTFCFLLINAAIYGQAHLLFKIGGNFDYLESTIDDKINGKPAPIKSVGGHFGMSLDVPLYEDIWAFSPDVQLLVKSVVDEPIDVIQAEVQIPLTFTCYILTDFGVDLGPSIGYRALDLTKVNGSFEKSTLLLEQFDFGIAGGVRFKLNDNLMLLGRYYYGLRDLNLVLQSQKTFNRSAQISLLYSGGGRGY